MATNKAVMEECGVSTVEGSMAIYVAREGTPRCRANICKTGTASDCLAIR